MCSNAKLFFYSFDFIGIVPQFRVLKYDSYKSIFSLIISIIIIISSIGFAIYSIIDYIKFNNPSLSYLIRFDNKLNNTIFLKDTLFMFRSYRIYLNSSETDFDYLGYYFSNFDYIELKIERCQIGKNINIKFKDDLEKTYKDKINNYYCISSEHGNLPLFYNPGLFNEEQSLINIFILNDNDNDNETCLDNFINIELITENDIIDHDNKTNPIITSSFFYNGYYDCEEYFYIDYRFEIIRYETDDGYFFNNFKNFSAVGKSEISLRNDYVSSSLGEITFQQSENNYSHYKRSYKKIQSLLADIMSVINILIIVGKTISNILLQKKMNKDIIKSLLNRNIYNEIKEHSLIENNKKTKKLFNNINKRVINSERKDINKDITESSNNRDNSNKLFQIKLSKNDLSLEENKKRKKIVKIDILKKINFFNVIKSYFCFKDKKVNLINMCNNFVMKDLCVERILGRLYELEKIFSLLSKEELSKLNLYIDKKFSRISYYINGIYIDEKNKKNNKKNISILK